MAKIWQKTMVAKKYRLLLVWGYFGLVAILNGFGVVLYVRGKLPDTPLNLVVVLFPTVLILFAFVGALIVSRRPKNRIGLLLFLPATSLAAFMDGVVEMFSNGVWAVPNPPTPLFLITIWFTGWNWILLILPLLYLLILFPTGRLLSPRWRWLLYYVTAVMLTIPVLTTVDQTLSPASKEGWTFANPIGLFKLDWVEPYFLPFFSVALPLGILLSLTALFLRFRRAQGVERAQIKWLFFASGIFAATYIPLFLQQGFTESTIWSSAWMVGMMTIPLSIGIAILRHQLFDIDLLINRTLVYGGLTLSIIAIYVIVVGYLGVMFQTEANLGVSLAATGLVAVLFGRLRNGFQRGVNRLMYGQRDEPYQLLTRLGQQLESAINPTSAMSLAVETVAQALKLPYVAIGLQRGEEKKITAVYGTEPDNPLIPFPLIYAGQPIGDLLVAPRSPNETLTPADQRLLSDLARQIGVTAHAHLLSANLEQARLRLVTERGEARRQLGRDLHDGVGHQLVGLTRQLEQAHATPPETETQLADINQQLITLTKHVRSLAHQLYPPELELLGLVGAIQEQVHNHSGLQIRLAIQPDLPPLPAEIETAVYYITLEALTNIEKHARATSCLIRLTLTNGSQPAQVELEIRDNGIGLPANLNGGLGLLSMQARAAEVGGICVIGNHDEAGTAVTISIPCPTTSE